MDPKIKVRFKAYDDKLLDQTVGEIVHTAVSYTHLRAHETLR